MDNYLLEDELAERAIAKKQMAERWNNYNLLEQFGVTDPWEQLDFAVYLENQRLYNESNCDLADIAQFKRVSIPLLVRIWKGMIVHHIASVQPMMTKEDCFYHLDHDGQQASMKKTPIEAQDHKLKAVWAYEAQQDLKRYSNLDAEAELCAVLAQEITLEMDRWALTTMRNNAKTKWTWDFNTSLGETIKEKYESLYLEVNTVADQVALNTGRGRANWIVTSPEIASIFETACQGFDPVDSDNFYSSLGVQHVGKVRGWNNSWFNLYKDPLFPSARMLLGYKGNHPYDSGYFYCPQIMLKLTPTVLDPDSFVPRKGLLTSGAHKMSEGGENFYATINVTNFII